MKRLRTPDWLAGLFGVTLAASLGAGELGLSGGWLLVTAFLAVVITATTALCDAPALPVAMDVLTVWAAIVAFPIAIARLLGGDASGPEIVQVLAVAGVFASAWWAMRKQDQPGLRPPPETRAMPVPARHDPST